MEVKKVVLDSIGSMRGGNLLCVLEIYENILSVIVFYFCITNSNV